MQQSDIKNFIFKFIEKFGGTIDILDKDKDLVRIIISYSLSKDIKKYGGKMVLEGTFYKSDSEYIALGNKTVIAMLKTLMRPTCSIITHPTLYGILFIFKMEAVDGLHRQRNGTIIGMIYDGVKIDIIDINEIQSFGTRRDLNQMIDLKIVEDGFQQANDKLQPLENLFKKETESSLYGFIDKTKETVTSYYIHKITKLESEITKLDSVQNQSPSLFHKLQNKITEQEILGKEYSDALKKIESNMSIRIIKEIIGVALVVPPINDKFSHQTTEIDEVSQYPYRYSDFTRFNNQINTELSSTTHERIVKNPSQWYEYHRLFEEANRDWPFIPNMEIIKRLGQLPSWWKIGDFGCGKAAIRKTLGKRVFSFDHEAIDENVTACDMKNTGLEDNFLEVIVFCLSLMNINWEDYIKEANRCLVINGTLLIAETTKSLDARLSKLREVLKRYNFQIYLEYELDRFTFIEATKRDFRNEL